MFLVFIWGLFLQNPAVADIYTEHAHQVVVAKYAPSGFYIASGDVSGKLRIWDTTQKEHLLKYEYQPFAGKIKDIAWTEDSKRIAVVGEGREKFGAVFLWDSGSSVGEITGHNKVINSVDIKQSRPYRLATGSDDNCAAFFEGPPFKFKFTIGDHSRFVNCVRFSPDGNRFATASADGQIYIYDGKTGEKVCALGGSKAHDGGIYAISWSPDSTHLLSASGDKTSKIWDVNVNSVVNTFTMGSNVLDQQLGCLWQKDHLLSISLSGYINYLDKNNPSKPLRVIKTGENDSFAGKGHTNQVSRMTVDESGQLVSCSMDDTVRYTNLTLRDYSGQGVVKLDVQPKCVAVGPGGYAVVVCIGQIVLLKDQKKCFSIDNPGYEPEVVAVHPSGDMVAVGGADGNVRLYSILGTMLKDEDKLLEAKGPVTDVAYSHDGAFLAVCDASKVVTVFSVADGYSENNLFYGHHAKIVCLAWSPDNEHFASGGMDMMVYVWTLSDPETRIKIQDAHRLHHVSSLAWLDEHTLVTTSHDASVKDEHLNNVWSVTQPATHPAQVWNIPEARPREHTDPRPCIPLPCLQNAAVVARRRSAGGTQQGHSSAESGCGSILERCHTVQLPLEGLSRAEGVLLREPCISLSVFVLDLRTEFAEIKSWGLHRTENPEMGFVLVCVRIQDRVLFTSVGKWGEKAHHKMKKTWQTAHLEHAPDQRCPKHRVTFLMLGGGEAAGVTQTGLTLEASPVVGRGRTFVHTNLFSFCRPALVIWNSHKDSRTLLGSLEPCLDLKLISNAQQGPTWRQCICVRACAEYEDVLELDPMQKKIFMFTADHCVNGKKVLGKQSTAFSALTPSTEEMVP
ncbi:hypothetical protein HPG69_001649 [Diceros bicornis minor]|uniref:WD repeat-containing protein 1 n=1 Tax=Diceros bicornis minor TaxID=77932 RepID=A0A7J7FH78_DICBM|nr:hypothetical protein HPG69_001649 [Diceros bicornis minor]